MNDLDMLTCDSWLAGTHSGDLTKEIDKEIIKTTTISRRRRCERVEY